MPIRLAKLPTLRQQTAKRGNVRPLLGRGIPVVSKLAGTQNPLGRRGFLKLGAALTGGLALGAKPGHAEPQTASPPADAPWSQSIGPGVVDLSLIHISEPTRPY